MIQKADYTLTKLDANYDVSKIDDLLGSEGLLQRMGDFEGAAPNMSSQGDRIAWAVQKNAETVGYMFIAIQDGNDVQAPSLHFAVIGGEDTAYLLAKDAIRYAYCNLPYTILYSRHLTSNKSVHSFDKKLGFEKDGDAYDDEQGQKWQNVALVL